ncbi:hypothetical protein PHSY_003392 [Pseudozyma hubeiensis SY62]|uniref:Uncharacterized protein n=1 Tax=Pseudozyma hubeiensis (strain SY62) TaxID=1305764 RepID=R9PCN6_PSEHS|nr:hypothetical protein PHSY_003392 [Pseudozyma hubeiensis SY62]GAC95815.1 hypothetical protein PHSY_003392 [Pseudozyma hubeiensis SY62]
MLRSGARGVARAAKSLKSDRPTNAALPGSRPSYSTAPLRHVRRVALRYFPATAASRARNVESKLLSYFSASQPYDPSSTQHSNALRLERFLPPLFDVDLIAQNDDQQALYKAIQHLDADLSWHLYKQLGKARRSIPTPVLDLIITLQCRKPVRSSSANAIDSQAAVRQVCDRVLDLCDDRARNPAGSSSQISLAASDADELSPLAPAVSLRLLYLLIVEEEQVAAARSPRSSQRRNRLSSMVKQLSANLDAQTRSADQHIDVSLRGRIAATLSRLGDTNAAYGQLQLLVAQATQADAAATIDPRPFDQLLSALARYANKSSGGSAQHLPSPVDFISRPIDETHPIIRALRLTLSTDVHASKANIHKCLQALDSATLWWLLPFELDGKHWDDGTVEAQPDDRYPLKNKWHPWQTSADGMVVSENNLHSFAERVALVLAQRGILQPALHIVTGLQSSRVESRSTSKVPDHDFFTVIFERLTERMTSEAGSHKSSDTHRGLSNDLHLAMKIYSIAHAIDADLDSRLNEAVVKALASCLPTSIVDLGPRRPVLTAFKAHIAQRNEQHGSKHALRKCLRQFTNMVLGRDPDLSKASLSYPAQATLLGLHMRARDYSFSKRLYELMRLRESMAQMWSEDPQAGTLRRSAQNQLAGPDRDSFMWLFAESTRSTATMSFAVQLYLDWVASGNVLPSRLNADFVRGLLRADMIPVVRRVLLELQENRGLLRARLARNLVASFADAGFPDLAVEMVVNVSQLTASTYALQMSDVGVDIQKNSGNSWLLSSTLELISVALDRSSRLPSSSDGESHRKVLRVFEEFRLGLTHHLFISTSPTTDTSPPIGDTSEAYASGRVTTRVIRMAYNAAMRASLSLVPNHATDATTLEHSSEGWNAVKSACLHTEELFKELKDLGAEPDEDTWNLRLTSALHASLSAPDQVEKQAWLQTALTLLEEVCECALVVDGPSHASGRNYASHHGDASIPEVEALQRVVVHPAVFAAAIDASRCCGNLEAGLQVYELHVQRGGLNAHVERARLLLLADLAEPHQWRNELDSLMQHQRSALMADKRFLQQLKMLSSAAMQRKGNDADPR